MATIILLLLALLALATHAKQLTFTNSPHFLHREGGWIYLGQMHCRPGQLELSLTASLNNKVPSNPSPVNLELAAIPSSIWPLQSSQKCSLPLSNTPQQPLLMDFTLAQDKQYSHLSSTSALLDSQNTYYFVLRDCTHSLPLEELSPYSELTVTVNILNNQQHLTPSEELYHWTLPLLLLLNFALILAISKEERFNWPQMLLNASLWTNNFALLFRLTSHLLHYSTGILHPVFTILHLLLHSVADSISFFLLILLAFGWTTTTRKINFEMHISNAIMLGLIHAILTLLNAIGQTSPQQTHLYDSLTGTTLTLFRLAAMGLFLYGLRLTLSELKKEDQAKRAFFHELATVGWMLFALLPLGLVFIHLVPPQNRQEAFFIGLESARLLCFCWLAVLGSWKGGHYRKALESSAQKEKDL